MRSFQKTLDRTKHPLYNIFIQVFEKPIFPAEVYDMNYKIVADSSSNMFSFSGVEYAYAPLTVISPDREYEDTPDLDIEGMVDDLLKAEGPTRSSCPNMHQWLTAFEGADAIFAITITSNLSGSYSSALQAGEEYMHTHPGAKVCVLDSLSTGPEMRLVIEKLRELIQAGLPFEEIEAQAREYMKRTHLFFYLKSLTNLSRNGRVSPAVAKLAGMLGICIVGQARDGVLDPMHKCRGEKKSMKTMLAELKEKGFAGGKLRIDHCMNPDGARQLKDDILALFPGSDIIIGTCGALCSFYAEKGGILVGFEGALK